MSQREREHGIEQCLFAPTATLFFSVEGNINIKKVVFSPDVF